MNESIELTAIFSATGRTAKKLNDLKNKENIKNNVFSIDAQSEHAPFFVSKIPSVYMYTSNKERHSKNDDWEYFNPDSIEACGILLEEFIRRVDQDLN